MTESQKEDNSEMGKKGRESNQGKIGIEQTKAIRQKQTLGFIRSVKVHTQ